MNTLQSFFVVAYIIITASCGQNNNTDKKAKTDAAGIANELPKPGEKSNSASISINNKTYHCTDVSAIADEKTDEIIIQVRSNTDNENRTFYFAFTVNGLGTGAKEFDTAGNYGEFTDINQNNYKSKYTDDCTKKNASTHGTIIVKSVKVGTGEAEGIFEAEFEGQLMKKTEVPPHPCANGISTNKELEFVNVKGSLKGSYVNTKNIPL